MADDRYELTTHDGKTVDKYTDYNLYLAEERLGYPLTIVQGSYHPGVGASAGTHDGGGVVDLAPWDWERKVRVLRELGFAAWHRPYRKGVWPEHIHAVLLGNEKASPLAKQQMIAYSHGRDGLAGNGYDGFWRPNPIKPAAYKAAGAEAPVAIDLRPWKLTLPTDADHNGTADEVKQPALATFEKPPWFDRRPDGIAFRANCGGATTSPNTKYARSELREMTADGKKLASWSNTDGKRHALELEQTITHLPVTKPHVVVAQIHDPDDDVIEILLQQSMLYVSESLGSGKSEKHPIAGYRLGERYKLSIVADATGIRVWYRPVNDANTVKVHVSRSGSGWFFKAGMYVQSSSTKNPAPYKNDAPSAYGEVVIHGIKVSHA